MSIDQLLVTRTVSIGGLMTGKMLIGQLVAKGTFIGRSGYEEDTDILEVNHWVIEGKKESH